MNKLFLIFAIMLEVIFSFGQSNVPALFLHLDKSVYTGNEIIWFTGYMMNLKKEEIDDYSVVYVTLNDPNKKKVIISSRFVLKNGICEGVLQIPDSLSAGEYGLVAYTDHLFTHPNDMLFHQWISVRYNNSSAIPYLRHTIIDTSYKSNIKVSFLPDSAFYHQRSHCIWKIKLTDTNNIPVKGIFSVSCVRKTRMINREPQIQTFGESCFMIPQLLKDTIPAFFIKVKYDNKKLKESAFILISHDSTSKIVQTEKDGTLNLNPSFLNGAYGGNATLSVIAKKDQNYYDLSIDMGDGIVNREIASINFPFETFLLNTKDIFTEEEKEVNKTILEKVIVKAKKLPDYIYPEYYQLPIMEGPCAAWICSCDHWKCGGCPPARNPVKGHSYEDHATGMFVTYNGCPLDTIVKPFIKKIKVINYPRPFQSPNYSEEHGDGMNFNTTLYWNYLIVTDFDGVGNFDFYTNDLVGHFVCMIQGISETGSINSKSEFIVK